MAGWLGLAWVAGWHRMVIGFDIGAGQGDVYGPTKASLASGEAVANARAHLAVEMNRRTIGACDEWFIDDGQAFVKPGVARNGSSGWTPRSLRLEDGEK